MDRGWGEELKSEASREMLALRSNLQIVVETVVNGELLVAGNGIVVEKVDRVADVPTDSVLALYEVDE